MSSPSSSTLPVIQPCSESSCIRLSVRRKVDLPQPDGPISAWTRLLSKASDTPFTAVNFPYIAVSLSVATRIVGSAIELESSADGETSAEAEDEDDEDEN